MSIKIHHCCCCYVSLIVIVIIVAVFLFCFAVLGVMFNPAVYTVSEGEAVPFTAVLNRAADRPVTVQFSTRDVSAIGAYSVRFYIE